MAFAGIDKTIEQVNNAYQINKFCKEIKDTKAGLDIAVDPQELAGHVGEMFDHHITAVEGLKNFTADTFNKVSEGVADKGGVEVDDGFVEDTTEALVSVVKAVNKNLSDSEVAGEAWEVIGNVVTGAHEVLRGVAGTGADAIHGVARAGLATGGVTPAGMPDIEDNAVVFADGVDTIKSQVEATFESVECLKVIAPDVAGFMDPSGAIEETLKVAAGKVVEALASDVAEEIGEVLLDSIPVVGLVMPAYRLVDGTWKAAVGVGGLAAASAIAVGGGVYGAAAAPFDGGAALGNSMSMAQKTASWSGSVGAEGTLIAMKGAAGVVSQIPGTQMVTTPLSLASGMAARSIEQARNGKASTTSTDADDAEDLWRTDGIPTVITKEALQVDKNYNLISVDGKRILQASNTKSKRGCQGLQSFMGDRMPHWAGYTLTFGDLQSSEKAGASASENEGASASLFSFSGRPGSYRLHSSKHGNNTLFFLGSTMPREWVVWDVPVKADGDWEAIELQWNKGDHKFKIRGHGGQFVMWTPPDGCFKATRDEGKATEFFLREASS